MVKISEKVEASLMLASYFETLGFKNGMWEFNYDIKTDTMRTFSSIWNTMHHHYLVLGGPSHINITDWNASDDTLLLLATSEAVVKGGGEENYRQAYIDIYDLLVDAKRFSGINTIETLKMVKRGETIDTLPVKTVMGGNGAAMRTGPIGLVWYKNIEKVIEESIIASRLTHNYYMGFLGGMVTALFTAWATANIPPWKWVDELIKLYNDKVIHKYYPKTKDHNIEDLDDYMSYWKRYRETRIPKLKYKNTLENFIYPENRIEYLMSYYPDPKIKAMVIRGQNLRDLNINMSNLGKSGIDCCIIALDCLLLSLFTPNSKTVDLDRVEYSLETFMTLVSIHPGDNDTTGSIGGTWFGALNGYSSFDKNRIKELEFYEELKKVSNKLI